MKACKAPSAFSPTGSFPTGNEEENQIGNLSWTLKSGVLTISGEGIMDDYSESIRLYVTF